VHFKTYEGIARSDFEQQTRHHEIGTCHSEVESSLVRTK